MTTAETWALLGGTLGASLLGSLHCAGMCGPLALISCGGTAASTRVTPLTTEGRPLTARSAASPHQAQLVYHLSRGAAYIGVGAGAGALGSLAGVADVLAGTQRIAMIVAGITLVLVGAGVLWTWSGHTLRIPTMPAVIHRHLARWHARVLAFPATKRALMLGLSAPLLPCGWLWAFVAIAAASGSTSTGAACMAAFWAGTVPALVGVVVGARVALSRLNGAAIVQLVRPAMGVILIALGLHFALTRARVADAVMDAAMTTASRAHAQEALSAAENQVPACCQERSGAATGAEASTP